MSCGGIVRDHLDFDQRAISPKNPACAVPVEGKYRLKWWYILEDAVPVVKCLVDPSLGPQRGV